MHWVLHSLELMVQLNIQVTVSNMVTTESFTTLWKTLSILIM